MEFDLVVKDGRIVTHVDVFEGTIGIKDGKIAAIMAPGTDAGAGKVIDAKGLHVMPGCIDPHVHLGLYIPLEEDMPALTSACAAGGITTLISFILDKRSLAELWHDWRDPIDKCAHIDIAYHLAIMSQTHIDEIEKAVELGITSFKFLMGYVGRAGDAINVLGASSQICLLGFEKVAKFDGVSMVHAEHIELCYPLEDRYEKDAKGKSLQYLKDVRPKAAEAIDLYQASAIAELVGSRVYFVHQTIGACVDIVAPFRARGNTVYLETCPHYLVLDDVGTGLKEPLLQKISPPIRSKEDQAKLWKAVMEGTIGHIGTDTTSNMHEQKVADGTIGGILLDFSAIEEMLPLIISEGYHKGKLTLPQIVALTSYNNAKTFDLTQKGAIEVGKDADIIIVDVNKKKHITSGVLHDGLDWNLYEGWDITGWPVTTLVRGEVVFDDDKVVGRPGFGKYIPRKPRK